ncbi:MAG: hypothetical protein K6E42_06605 [Synergistes sp.]|nr:hypothetical protein [Synergistes sp.]
MSVLFLSFATIICYGYALGGLGSYALGVPKPVPTAAGLVCGTLCAFLAIKIWRRYIEEIEEEQRAHEAKKSCNAKEKDED